MTAEQIIQEFKDKGGDTSLIECRVPNLMAGAIHLINGYVEENETDILRSASEILEICESIINSEPVQVLFERIDRMKPLQDLK